MNAPPPGMPDPMKLSRMIRVLNDYVQEGLIQKPERAFKEMTEGELESLIEAARSKKAQREEPAEAPNSEEPAPAEEAAEPPPVNPGPQAVTPQPEEGTTVSEGISEQDFKDRYPKGTRVEYSGDEYVVTEHSKMGAEGMPFFEAVEIGEEARFTTEEHNDGEIAIHASPTKIPQKVEYPPQVFLVARVVEGMAVADIYLDHQKLAAENPTIDGDTIMEAISDPDEPQGIDGGTLTYTTVG